MLFNKNLKKTTQTNLQRYKQKVINQDQYKSAILQEIIQNSRSKKMLEKFFNMKPKSQNEKMEIEGQQKQSQLVPWVEKYRPNKLDELSYQDEVTNSLKNVLKTGNLPHLLFYGPAGTGKTSAIIALSKELYGPKFYKSRVLELNASDDRGINVVRQRVKTFAQEVVVRNPDKNYICPPYKIIVLDEADLMTKDAQSALRRVIEDNSATTRFCIICNYITKIIEPVASRCVKFRFKPIPTNVQLQKLKEICDKQKVKLDDRQLMNLLEKGDLRQSINSLQSLHLLKQIPANLLPTPVEYCQKLLRSVLQASNIKKVYELSKQAGYDQYPMDEVLVGLITAINNHVRDDKKKCMMMEVLSKCQEALILGATDLQYAQVLSQLYFISISNF